MARYLWLIYIGLTLLETVLLMLGGMNLFDALCQSFATTATGGFSTKQDSISYWNSPYIEYVISAFMILSGVNFSLYYFAPEGEIQEISEGRRIALVPHLDSFPDDNHCICLVRNGLL